MNLQSAFESIRKPKKPRPPGPKGLSSIRSLKDFMGGQVEFMQGMQRQYGDVANFRLGTFDNYLISDPAMIHEVLVSNAGMFKKDQLTHDLENLLGHGLLTSEGEFWKRQRKLAAPALARKQIASYADTMVAYTEEMVEGWTSGSEMELHTEMMKLTMNIVVKTLFNLEPNDELNEVEDAIDKAMRYFHLMTHTVWRWVPEFLPMRARSDFEDGLEKLDKVVYALIHERRSNPVEGDDLLLRLIQATDDEGNQMTDTQLRDEVITMFLAGHETTALATTYTWYLLNQSPEKLKKVFDEVDRVLGGRSAVFEDVANLRYVTAAVKESLRILPPAWIIGREAMEEVQVGEWTLPKGAQVLIAQCVLHQQEKFFPEPERFLPERWMDPSFEKGLPKHAYMPFGGGARVCIGNHYAMMEVILVIATMAQQAWPKMTTKEPLRTQPAITLRPAHPIEMIVERR